MKSFIKTTILIILISSGSIQAQDVGGKTRVSQFRSTTANIGKCDITIEYHSPSVNDRKIFGGIIPYDFVVDGVEYPWRAGSNERTSIEFSNDVVIEGQRLPAGSYGFLVLVNKDEWTLIFSSGKSWGAFNYDPSNDVLRVPVKTEKASFQEWLSYEYNNPTSESVDIQIRWENTAVSFKVETNALENILVNLNKKEDKKAADYQELAIRTLEKKPEEFATALAYLEESYEKIDDYEEEAYRKAYHFTYKILKGEILLKMNEEKEGNQLIEEALNTAQGFDIYYYALNKLLVKGQSQEAFDILQAQIKRDPENRANFLALGEYYLKQGDQVKATESFKEAYNLSLGSRGENYAKYMYLQNKMILDSN